MYWHAGTPFDDSPASSQGSTRHSRSLQENPKSEAHSLGPSGRSATSKHQVQDKFIDEKYGQTASASPKKGKKGKGKSQPSNARRTIGLGRPPRSASTPIAHTSPSQTDRHPPLPFNDSVKLRIEQLQHHLFNSVRYPAPGYRHVAKYSTLLGFQLGFQLVGQKLASFMN